MTDSCDDVFRRRMIETIEMRKFVEHGMFSDEDHTYHLSEQEYFYYKNNKWWLHSKKSGSNTLPLRNLANFKQALSTLNRLHQEAGGEQLEPDSVLEVQTKEIGIEFILYLVFGKILGGLPKNYKSRKMRQAKASG